MKRRNPAVVYLHFDYMKFDVTILDKKQNGNNNDFNETILHI